MVDNLKTKIKTATKWSAITEIATKLLTPIVSMVLARILTPEAFGIVATINMIITFAEIFTDAGFQKYLIQHEFTSEEERFQNVNVAFWSNLCMSLLIWTIIAIFASPLASVVGNPGLGNVVIIACAAIPLAAFSSIQMALYKRSMDFKTLFKVRIVGICIPIFVTVPLALYFKNFWALIIGHLFQQIFNAIMLTWYSQWKPKLYFSFQQLKEMLSFTIWSMIEQISIWLTSYFDVFIVGRMLSQNYLGLYKTSSTIVGQFMGLITATTTPILFSALSRLQSDKSEFQNLFFSFQKLVSTLVIPIGVGIYCYSDFITRILLGEKWMEASGFIGLWGLTSAIAIVLSHYSSEVYRALGKPKLSVLAQWLHIIVLWPVVLISAKHGFESLYVSRSLVRFELILVNLIIMYYVIKISPLKMILNVMPSLVASIAIIVISYTLKMYLGNSIIITVLSILCSIIGYFGIIILFKTERNILCNFIKRKR